MSNGSTIIDLGTLGGRDSWGQDVNNSGEVVGFSAIAGGTQHAFLYDNGQMFDLNSLLTDISKQYEFNSAMAINDNGWIVGSGTTPTGQMHALLAIPDYSPTPTTPEPSTMLLMGLGVLGVAYMRRRAKQS